MIHKQKILFIINPASGSSLQRKETVSKIIGTHIDRSIFDPEIIHSTDSDHVLELSANAVRNGTNVVVAVGGDGSINLAARSLIGTDVMLGIIPVGSGNGLAHHLHIPINVIKAVEIINRRKSILMDTVNINDKVFFSIAGVGFDALIAKKYARSEMRGFLPYFRLVTENYPLYKPKKYVLNIDGNEITRRALFVAFANAGQFGYNTIIAPNAKVDDGLIDLCIVRKVPLIKAPLVVHQLFNSTIDQSAYIEVIKARQVVVRRKKNRRINCDGESLKLKRKLIIEVNPKSLRVIVPGTQVNNPTQPKFCP